MNDSDKVFSDSLNLVNAKTQQIGDAMASEAKQWGYELSSNITDAWKNGSLAVTNFSNNFTTVGTSITAMLDAIIQKNKEAAVAAEEYARAQLGAGSSSGSSGINAGIGSTSSSSKPSFSAIKSDGIDGKSAAKDMLKNNLNKKSNGKNLNSLNQYLYSKYKGTLTNSQQQELGSMLGVKVTLGKDGKIDSKTTDAIKKKLKNMSFAEGGMIRGTGSSTLRRLTGNGDDLWTVAKNGESILTPEQTQALIKTADIFPKIASSFKTQSAISALKRNPMGDINVNIENNVSGIATNEVVDHLSNQMDSKIKGAFTDVQRKYYAKGGR